MHYNGHRISLFIDIQEADGTLGGMALIDQFPAEAEISVTDFRSEEKLTSMLARFPRLRVRGETSCLAYCSDVRSGVDW